MKIISWDDVQESLAKIRDFAARTETIASDIAAASSVNSCNCKRVSQRFDNGRGSEFEFEVMGTGPRGNNIICVTQVFRNGSAKNIIGQLKLSPQEARQLGKFLVANTRPPRKKTTKVTK